MVIILFYINVSDIFTTYNDNKFLTKNQYLSYQIGFILNYSVHKLKYWSLQNFENKTEPNCQIKSVIELKFKEIGKIFFITREPGDTGGLVCVR